GFADLTARRAVALLRPRGGGRRSGLAALRRPLLLLIALRRLAGSRARRWRRRRGPLHRSCGRRRCGSRRSLGGGIPRVLLDPAQFRDMLLVLVVGFRKGVPASAVGDEEQFLGAGRVGGGLDRRAPRIGDRSRRQALD